MDGDVKECVTDSSSSSDEANDDDADVLVPPLQQSREQSTTSKKKKKKKKKKKNFFSNKKKAASSSLSSDDDDDDDDDDDCLDLGAFEFLDDEERAIMSSNRLEHRIEDVDVKVDAAFSALHSQFFTSSCVDVEKFVKPSLHDEKDEHFLKFKVAAERLRAKVHRLQSHQKLQEHEMRQAAKKQTRSGQRRMHTNLNGKFLRLDENVVPKTANLRSDVANADSAVNIGLKLSECLRRDSVFQNREVTTYDDKGNIVCNCGDNENASAEGSSMMVERDLHFDGEEESVKRFLLATRLIVAQIAEFLRPRGPGFNEKSPSENDTEGDKSIKKKSETEEVTFTHADPFDAYDSSDEDKAVRSDTGILPLPPPLGSHVVRCVETPKNMDFVRSLPDGMPLSVYFQENNAYNFKDIRTADHFLDGSRQKIRSSTKIQAIPRAEMYGASLLIHMEMPGPMDREESTPNDVCREGCYVELNGASGHPDYLSRWRRRDNCPKSEQSIDTEVYMYTLPTLKAHEFYLRKPIGELCGDIKIECEKTGLEAILKFHEYDAEFSPAMRNIVTGVVSKKETNEVKRMLFGTWDSVIFWEDPNKTKNDDLQIIFAESEKLLKGVLYDDHKHAVTQRGCVRPLSTSTTVRSLATAIKCPQTMSRDKLWMAIQSSIRYSKKLGHLGSLCSKLLLGHETLDCQDEMRGTGTLDLDMGWEMTTLVTTKLPPDAEPPLPAIWDMRPSPPPKKGHVEKYACGLFNRDSDEEEKEEHKNGEEKN